MYMWHVRNKMGLRYLNLPFSEKHALLENKHAYVSAQKLNTQNQISAITGRIGLMSRHIVPHMKKSSSVLRMLKALPNSSDLNEQFVLGAETTFR